MKKESKHIVLINGIYPPDNGASGQVANRFVGKLIESGFRVTVVTTDRNYNAKSRGITYNGKVIRVRSVVLGNSKMFRLFRALRESYYLLKKAKRLKPNAFIVCTDPPLLNWFSSRLLRDEKWMLWTMDSYPEAFVASKLISAEIWMKGSWLLRAYKKRLINYPPSALLYLGQKQKEFIEQKYNFSEIPNFIMSCGINSVNIRKESDETPSWKKNDNKIYFAYCGNLGEAHSLDFITRLISLSDVEKHCFILSVFGVNVEALTTIAINRKNVYIVDWISESEMNHIDIQIVTLKKEWTHICVPSKAVSAICYETPIIFHGSADGDTYDQFKEASWHIKDDNNLERQILGFYTSLSIQSLNSKKAKTPELKKRLLFDYEETLTAIEIFIKNE